MPIPGKDPIGSAWDTGHYCVEPEELDALDAELRRHRERRIVDPTMIPREVLLRVGAAIGAGQFDPPRPPDLALRMMRLAEDATSSAADMAKLAQEDAFLAGRLLQLANSVQFGPRNRRIEVMCEAVTRLGMDRVRNVVLAAAMRQNVYSGTRFDLMTQLWRASIGAAVGCRLLNQTAGWDDDGAFFTGLVHDMGKPVLVWVLDEVIREGYPREVRFNQLAPAIFHMLHCRVGAMIVRGWGLPPGLASVVAHHHDPDPPASLARSILMLRVANLIYEAWCSEGEALHESQPLHQHRRVRELLPDPERVIRLLRDYPTAMRSQFQGW